MNNILLQTACADIVSMENDCKNGHKLFDRGDNCIPTISAPLNDQNSQYVLSQNYPHLNIANNSFRISFDVNLSIGLDFCYNFISGNVERDQIGEPIVIESKLGLILTGH